VQETVFPHSKTTSCTGNDFAALQNDLLYSNDLAELQKEKGRLPPPFLQLAGCFLPVKPNFALASTGS
jgi:hypothetical protein